MPYPSKTDRNSILLAAVEEISHSGIRDLSLRNLASLLGLAPTALYRYFSDRAELEAALANECAQRLENVLRNAIRGVDATEALRRISSGYVRFAREHRNLYEVMMSPHSSKYDYSAKQSLWKFTTERVALLSGATKAPEAAVALWALLHGTVALEATQVLGEEKPASGLRFIFEAWLSAVSSASPVDQAEKDTIRKERHRKKKTGSSKLRRSS
jgi:AcrR family transcriptional regulator